MPKKNPKPSTGVPAKPAPVPGRSVPAEQAAFAAVYTKGDNDDWDLAAVFVTGHQSFEELVSQSSGAENVAQEHELTLQDPCHLAQKTKIVGFNSLVDIPAVLQKDEQPMLVRRPSGKKP